MYGKPDHQRFWEKCTTKISSNTANVFQSREIFDTGKSIVVVEAHIFLDELESSICLIAVLLLLDEVVSHEEEQV